MMSHLGRVGQDGGALAGRSSAERIQAITGVLLRCPLFAVLDDAALRRLCETCGIARFPRRRPLYQQGVRAEALFVLASGRARVVREGGESRLLTVAYRVPGELLGETALTEARTYRATATATEEVDAVRIPLNAVDALLTENPVFANRMLGLMVERRLQAERRVESLLSRTVESRVAEFLLDAAQRHGVSESRGVLISVKYTHQEIADYVGSTRETVTLTLGELKRRDLVLFDHRRMVLVKRDELAKLV
jgi:CRP-like cAMP-binding protein